MSAREDVLNAFETILIEEGERASTLDAVAAQAQVSKGGLLYHFRSKSALIDGLVERLRDRAAEDATAMREAPTGPAAHYITTSVMDNSPFDRTILAAVCLAQGSDVRARQALQEIRLQWLHAIDEEVGDRAVSCAILLMGDGLYYNASLTGSSAAAADGVPAHRGTDPGARAEACAGEICDDPLPPIGDLLAVVETLKQSAGR